MTEVEVEAQGEHRFVVRLSGQDESAESWFTLSPAVLDDLTVGEADEEDLVRRTVGFLLQHQEIADFPDIVDLEDVIATYDDYLDVMRSAVGR
jgi:hypothetical protein